MAARLHWPSLLLGLAAFGLDRGHKYVQVDLFGGWNQPPLSVLPVLDYTLAWNPGISLSLLAGLPVAVLAGGALIAILGLLVWWWRTPDPLVRFAVMLIAGGAISNAIDRLAYGAVADFFHLHWGALSFFVFNIADVAISAGVLLLVVDVIRSGRTQSA